MGADNDDRVQPQVGPDKPGDEPANDSDVQRSHDEPERRPGPQDGSRP